MSYNYGIKEREGVAEVHKGLMQKKILFLSGPLCLLSGPLCNSYDTDILRGRESYPAIYSFYWIHVELNPSMQRAAISYFAISSIFI